MYNFIDTTEALESTSLPSEALKINGEYIEDLIPGYRTLHVSGREALSPEVDYYEIGIRDGADLKSRRYPPRTITVTYQLVAADDAAFRDAFNTLASILDVQEAQLIFNDEDDKFFTGTPSRIGEVEPGRNAVKGEIDFLCSDPFKYSVLEYEAEAYEEDPSTILIDYGGTYKAFPVLVAEFYNESEVAEDGTTATELTGNGDCGYVAFFNEYEKIIQLGDPDEVDSEEVTVPAKTLINQVFKANTAWGTAAQAPWQKNAGPVIGSGIIAGNIAMAVASYAVPATPKATSGTLLNNKAAADGAPTFYYTVTAKTSKRTADSVRVDVAITARLKYATSYFGKGLGLKGSLYIGGAWRDITIKRTSEYWRGQSGHTVNMSFTVGGLTAAQTALTGIKFKVARTDSYGYSAGRLLETACSNLPVSVYVADVPETYHLAAKDYGSGTGYHGPSITRAIPADSTGAANFTCTYKQKMCIGNGSGDTAQCGAFQINLSAADGTTVAGVRIVKSASGKSAKIQLYANGKKFNEASIDLSYNNKYFGTGAAGQSKIVKHGNTITFEIGGYYAKYTDDAIAGLTATKLTIMFEKNSTAAALSFNGISEIKFIKAQSAYLSDIPNKFTANDVLEADCASGEVFLNGLSSPKLGASANNWEDFYLQPGLNQIGIAYSEWVQTGYEPKIKVRYREVFI